jgi:hypothetical protein
MQMMRKRQSSSRQCLRYAPDIVAIGGLRPTGALAFSGFNPSISIGVVPPRL